MAAPQCISGRTSYLHVRLAFHPYPQVIPQFCNTGGCEPRRTFTSASLCSWVAHVVSGRMTATGGLAPPLALFRLGFPLAPPLFSGVNRATAMHSPDHSTKGTPSAPWWLLPQWPLTACTFAGSGSLSSPLRGAFHLSLTVLVHYRSRHLFSLGGWSPLLPTGLLVSRGTQDLRPPLRQGSPTGLSPSLMRLSSRFGSPNLGCVWQVLQPRRGQSPNGLGFSRFARHYYGNLV